MNTEKAADVNPAPGKATASERLGRTGERSPCPGHEAESTSTWEEQRRGWHKMHCKHCGKDMSIDSGD